MTNCLEARSYIRLDLELLPKNKLLNSINYKLLYCACLILISSTVARAHVSLDYPKGGETFAPGSDLTIKWSIAVDHGGNNFDLYYSINGGDVWQEIELDIDKSFLEYAWNLPITETSKAKIKIVQDNIGYDNYEDISANFIISNKMPPIEPEVITAAEYVDLDSEKEINLSNFPNPFHSYTTIQFSILKEAHVQLNMYNTQGRLVSQLMNADKKKGSHEVLWKNDGFAEGVYICKLMVEDQYFSKKIVLIP